MSYDVEKRDCVSSIGRNCPKLSIGIGPNCLCTEYDYYEKRAYEFNQASWKCLPERTTVVFHIQSCPNTSHSWPLCDEAFHTQSEKIL